MGIGLSDSSRSTPSLCATDAGVCHQSPQNPVARISGGRDERRPVNRRGVPVATQTSELPGHARSVDESHPARDVVSKSVAAIQDRVDGLGAELSLPGWQRAIPDPRKDTYSELFSYLRRQCGTSRISMLTLDSMRRMGDSWLARNRVWLSETARTDVLERVIVDLAQPQKSDTYLASHVTKGTFYSPISLGVGDIKSRIAHANELRAGRRWVPTKNSWHHVLAALLFLAVALAHPIGLVIALVGLGGVGYSWVSTDHGLWEQVIPEK
ncbi:hypothetical protein 1 [Hubei tombus-like virus 24]|uniref:hypothetical protein 1 n=1 Tax=Hubei tombus-like virus 24 TaxID=1923271 RepID=UPI00090B3654|nr:hypothetical protein 1 [Hubei tombus-like virus 24]APG76282.1 hypothetical protein 1 [Hubei tombus-like virus 24]